MSDYKQSPVVGTRWNRARRVIINNEYGQVPSIEFVEELAMTDGEEVLKKDLGRLLASFDINGIIPLIDPNTGESLGASVSHQELYVALHSLYIQLAQARDSGE